MKGGYDIVKMKQEKSYPNFVCILCKAVTWNSCSSVRWIEIRIFCVFVKKFVLNSCDSFGKIFFPAKRIGKIIVTNFEEISNHACDKRIWPLDFAPCCHQLLEKDFFHSVERCFSGKVTDDKYEQDFVALLTLE